MVSAYAGRHAGTLSIDDYTLYTPALVRGRLGLASRGQGCLAGHPARRGASVRVFGRQAVRSRGMVAISRGLSENGKRFSSIVPSLPKTEN